LLHRDRLTIEHIPYMKFLQKYGSGKRPTKLVQDNEDSSDSPHRNEDRPVRQISLRKRPPPSDVPCLSTPPMRRRPRVEATTDMTVSKSTSTQETPGPSAANDTTLSTSSKPHGGRFPWVLADLMTGLETNQLHDWIRWDTSGTAVLVKHMTKWPPVEALRPYFGHLKMKYVKSQLATYDFVASNEDG
jgi:hypothetical protein